MSEFFGELYLRSTRPFLVDQVTEAEARFLRHNLPDGRWLDLGCGHGRHLAHLGGLGVDRDQLSLREARSHGAATRADFTALPFRDESFEGGWCWYNSLGTLEDAVVPRVLAEVRRVMKPGAVFIIQGTHPARAREQPHAGFDGTLSNGDHLVEAASYDTVRRRDEIRRTLRGAEGRTLQADFFIRYYDLDEWRSLLADASFEVRWSVGSVDGAPVEESSTDLIVGAQKTR